ncbi:MAG: CPBP family glutamic-type intramembrane protease [Waterburya sp.]
MGKDFALRDWLNLNILLPNPFVLNIPWFNLPHCANWTILLVALGIYGLFTLTLGLVSSFLQWNLCRSFTTIVRITVTSLVAPAMLEEIVFRGWLLPDPGDDLFFDTYIPRATLSLFLFIVYHPLNASTFFPQGKETFFDPIFLTLAAALGIICTITYYQTDSLWLPILIHWLTVVIWLLCFGGLAKLKFSAERS